MVAWQELIKLAIARVYARLVDPIEGSFQIK